jgi:hypothetical protein
MTEGEAIKFRYFNILEKALIRFFNQQNKKVLENFILEFDIFKRNLARIIKEDAPRAERILKDIYRGIYRDYGAWQFREITGNLNGFNPYTLEVITAINNAAREQVRLINESTQKIIEKIGKRAIERGWTIQETTKKVQEKVKGIALYRAKRIARFETISRSNNASLSGASQVSDKLLKYWIYTHDKRVRPTHKHAGIKYTKQNAIKLDEKFKVGSALLLYPADRNGDKKEIFNCRCTIGYIRRD